MHRFHFFAVATSYCRAHKECQLDPVILFTLGRKTAKFVQTYARETQEGVSGLTGTMQMHTKLKHTEQKRRSIQLNVPVRDTNTFKISIQD